jgi:two-component system chemotaxis response regulator CheY
MHELKFLVVDDMMTMRKIVRGLLKEAGVLQAEEAPDGAAAWKLLEEAANANKPFQIVVSDWNMPELLGIDLLKRCRSHPLYKDVGFLLVTAEAELEQVKAAMAAGVDNYVVKPFSPDAFRDKLQAVYQKRYGQR